MEEQLNISENYFYDEKGYMIQYQITGNDPKNKIEVIEKISSDNSKYSYYEKYVGDEGITILGATTDLIEDSIGASIPTNIVMGIWNFDIDLLKSVKDINKFIENMADDAEPISNLEKNMKKVKKEEKLEPYFHKSVHATVKKQYFESNKENIGYYVYRNGYEPEDNLSFVYKLSLQDFRQQLNNLYTSVIRTGISEKDVVDITGISSDIMPNQFGIFDANNYYDMVKKQNDRFEINKQLKK